MKNFKAIVFLVFLLLYTVGVCIGSARQVLVANQSGMYEYLEGAVSGYDVSVSESVKSIFKDNIKLFGCLFIGGFFVIGPLVLGAIMIIKGYSTGFAITAVLRLFGIRGLTFCMANLISAIIIVPALCWYSCNAIENIKEIRHERSEFLKRLLLLLLIILLVLIVDSGIRGYLSAILMKFGTNG
ncbi:MAG: stage II sporulation protein M [Clostridia bacterium]|nr:stage II sporulation protein M [Clostridia bacterium]